MPTRGATPTCSGPGEGEQLWFLGTLATIRVPGDTVNGRFSLIEFLFPRDASPPLHTHPQDESFIVLDGRIAFLIGEQRVELGPGGNAVFPSGTPHTFLVVSETARAMVLSTPAGIERLCRDIGVPATAPTLPPPDSPRPGAEELDRIFSAHAQTNLGPPLSEAS